MYPVTDLYNNEIKNKDRLFTCNIIIEHSQGTLELSDVDLSQGSLVYSESSQDGEEFTVGATVASDISFTIFNKPEYEGIKFMGATVFVTIGLLVQEGVDAHFLQPSQPSKMKGMSDDIWEYIPLGRFNIDDVNIKTSTISFKAMDNMIELDKPYSLSKLSYPATLYQIYVNICNIADISIGTLNFPNKDYVVSERPSDDLTLRDVLGYVAELSGSFAKCNRNGALELKWYELTDLEIEPNIRYDFIPSDDIVQIRGVMASTEDTTYLAGSEDYAIDLTENPLLQGEYELVLPNIFNNVKDTIFTPYTSSFKGNPAIQAGDIIKQIDKNGKIYNTLVTKMTYKYRGKGSLEAKGLPEVSKGYKGSTNRKLAEIRRKIDIDVGDKITDLEQAILQATELITGELGGYVLKRENELLIMDNPDPNLAVKVWRWNLGGLGYSSNGVNGIYELAMTMNGAINANFITTGLLSANLVQTGILQANNGKSFFDLDNGELRISHGGVKYTQADIGGFKKHTSNGESYYLSGITVLEGSTIYNNGLRPSPVTINLPLFMRGENVTLYPSLKDYSLEYDSRVQSLDGDFTARTRIEITSKDFTANPPWIEVTAFSELKTWANGKSNFNGLKFQILAVID